MPYLCTSKSCGLKMFPTRHAWFDHELQLHWKEWNCKFCHRLFETAERLENHMQSNHADKFTETQLSALIDMCESAVDKVPASSCPFCDSWEVHLRSKMIADAPGALKGTEILVVTPKQFRSHVSRHMEQLA